VIDVLKLLHQKSVDYDPFDYEDSNVQFEVSENGNDVYFIIKEGLLQNSKAVTDRLSDKGFFVVEEFSLGRPYVSSEFHFSLVHAKKKRRKKYRVGIFCGATYDTETMVGSVSKLVCPPNYNNNFHRYINTIQDWINNSIELVDDNNMAFEFATVDYPDEIRYPRYYAKRNVLVKQLLDIGEVEKISEVAEIIIPSMVEGTGTTAIVNIDEQRPYRFDNISILYGKETNVKLQEGDILFPRLAVDAKPFIVTKKTLPQIDACAGDTTFVIRTTRILPEYLWLYLISEVSLCINERINSDKNVRILSYDDICNFPVIKQELPNEEYIKLCDILNSPNERRYNARQFATCEQLKTGMIESAHDVLGMELLSTINLFYADQLDEMVSNDLCELNECYRSGAYKAVLILAGSLLEAILIDWLSEIHGIDYFVNDFMVPNGRGGQKRADLIDYINEINVIKMPNWVEEATKAHAIRRKRNLVHAKLCLNTDEINKAVCDKVIEYLKDVLVSRGIHMPEE